MSDELWDDQEDDTPLVRSLRKQLKDASKSKTDAEARAAAAEGKLTVVSLSDALKAKGVNPKAARFIVSDGVDTTDDKALSDWLEENKELFPASDPEAPAQQPPAAEQPGAVDEQIVNSYQQLTGLPALQSPADINKLVEAERTLSPNATQEQVREHFRAAGL